MRAVELKPPSPEEGDAGLQAFREAAKLHEDTLRSRMSREFYRKDLAKWQKLYATLAGKRAAGSATAGFGRSDAFYKAIGALR